MPYPTEFIQTNDTSRAALRALLAKLTDAQYKIVLDADWTVGSTLAHVALFDHRALKILERWEHEGVSPSPNDTDIRNAAAPPFLQVLAPADIARMVNDFAEALDAKLASLPTTFSTNLKRLAANRLLSHARNIATNTLNKSCARSRRTNL